MVTTLGSHHRGDLWFPCIALHAIIEHTRFEDACPEQHARTFLNAFGNAWMWMDQFGQFTDRSTQAHHQGDGFDRAGGMFAHCTHTEHTHVGVVRHQYLEEWRSP